MSQPPKDPEDYAHAHDAQAQRSRTELWIIVAVVLVVLVGSLLWRASTGSRPEAPKGYGPTRPPPNSQSVTPAAGAGVAPRPL